MENPKSLQNKPKSKLTLDDCVFLILRNANLRGEWMNFWTISERILNTVNRKYGEPNDFCINQKYEKKIIAGKHTSFLNMVRLLRREECLIAKAMNTN